MLASSSFYMPLTEWRHYLQDINFWLNGYINSPAYHKLEEKLLRYRVQWNVGVGPTACFTRAISSFDRDVTIRRHGPCDHVIEVDMKQAAAVLGNRFDINDMLHIKVAEQLGLLEHKYDMVDDAELRYYTYDMEKKQDDSVSPLELKSIAPQIMQNLLTKKYLLVVHNLDRPIRPIVLDVTTEDLWLPAPRWNGSFWIVSTTSQDVYDRSNKPDEPRVIKSFSGDDILILTLHSLKQAAKYISVAVGQGEEKYWHHVALYERLLFSVDGWEMMIHQVMVSGVTLTSMRAMSPPDQSSHVCTGYRREANTMHRWLIWQEVYLVIWPTWIL